MGFDTAENETPKGRKKSESPNGSDGDSFFAEIEFNILVCFLN